MDKQQKQTRMNPKWLDKKIHEIQKAQQQFKSIQSPENDESRAYNQALSAAAFASFQKSKNPSESTNKIQQTTRQCNRLIPISKYPVDQVTLSQKPAVEISDTTTNDEHSEDEEISKSWHSWLEKSHVDLGPLPEGWKYAENQDGEIYFVNQSNPNCQFAQWDDPRTELMEEALKETIRDVGDRQWLEETEAVDLGPLPEGWKIGESVDGEIFFVNQGVECAYAQSHDPRAKMMEDALQKYLRDHVAPDENDDEDCNEMKIPEIKITNHDDSDQDDNHATSQMSNYYRKSGVLDPPIHSSSPKKSENVFNFQDVDEIQNASLASSFEVVEFENQFDNNVKLHQELKNDDEDNETFENTSSDHESENDNDESWCPWLEKREPVDLGPLPENWKMVKTEDGAVAFINYSPNLPRPIGQWNDPRITLQTSTKKVKKPEQHHQLDLGLPLPSASEEGQNNAGEIQPTEPEVAAEEVESEPEVSAEEVESEASSTDGDQDHDVQRDQLSQTAIYQLSENLSKLNDESSPVSHSHQSLLENIHDDQDHVQRDQLDDQHHNQEQVDEEETENEIADIFRILENENFIETENFKNAIISGLFLVCATLYFKILKLQFDYDHCRRGY